jgi:peptide/nickel transport system substrate-binding protein
VKGSQNRDEESRVLASRRAIRGLTMLTAIVLAIAAAACGSGAGGGSASTSSAGGPPRTPTGTLRVALDAQPTSIDPSLAFGSAEMAVMRAVYDGLVARDTEHPEKLVPALATSWRHNADASQWTFTLREGVKFSDGAPFDAAAAKRSFEYTKRPGSYPYIGSDAKITTPDSHTLVMSYTHPVPDLFRLVRFTGMISPNLLRGSWKEAEKRVMRNAVGTGPYVMDSFSPEAGFVGHANPHYWGKGPYIEKLEMRPIPEESARLAALQAGDIDLVMGVSPRAAMSVADDPRLETFRLLSTKTDELSLPTQKKPFDDVRVRRALAYAIDPEAVAKNVLLGQATVIRGLVPAGVFGSQEPTTKYSYDPSKAKALLAEAGVETPVKVTMASQSSSSADALVGQALAEQAKAAGFDITFKVVDRDSLTRMMEDPQRKIDILLWSRGWADGGPGGLEFVADLAKWRGARLLQLISKINETPDGPERVKLVGDALENAAKEVPVIPLWQYVGLDVAVKGLRDHVPSKDGFLPSWTTDYLDQ